MRTQRCQFNRGIPKGETPHPLYFGKLLGFIDQLDTKFNDRRYEFMLNPLEHGLKSKYFRDHITNSTGPEQTSSLMNHLVKLLTGRVEPRSNLTIVDLSGIPFEIVDITVAVLTRLMFEMNFWTPPAQRHPTLLVFEEAHNYIPRREQSTSFAKHAVERVAKEGRKYGVSAMIISQRPSELSETVLSQCNSFVVMRMSNPDDQHYVSRVVGDHFAGVLDMLPVLRPGEAFVIGDCVLMPMRTLVQIPNPTPQSADMDFFKQWASPVIDYDLDDIIEHWRRQDRSDIDPTELDPVLPAAQRTGETTEPVKPSIRKLPHGVPAGVLPNAVPFRPRGF
jgi:DNA helicase HerA-like ATPase